MSTPGKNAFKLVKWPSLKVICGKLTKSQLLKVAKFYRRLYGGETHLPPTIQTYVCKFLQLLRPITFKLGKYSNIKALFPVVLTNFP